MIKIIKRFFPILSSLLISSLVYSQDFSISVENNILVDTLGSEIIFDIVLKNNSSSNNLSVSIIRTEIYLPDSWSSSLCFDNCFAPFIDSLSTSEDFGSSPLSPGESRTISLHVFPLQDHATAVISLRLYNENNISEEYIVDFEASTIANSVDENGMELSFNLEQNYPNPFNPSTTINYTIPVNNSGDLTFVSLKVYNILGSEIKTLVSNYQRSGKYSIKFDAQQNLSSGVYFYKLSVENYQQVKKMILEK